MLKKTLLAGVAGIAAAGLATGAMAQTEQQLDVEIQVEEYAELTVQEGQIILHLVDAEDWLSGLNDGPNGQTAKLLLQANYRTNLEVTSESGTITTDQGHEMVLTSDNGNELGAWPQISGQEWSGQSTFGWDTSQLVAVMDSLHREDGNSTALGGDGTGTGTGIPAGAHEINVGVSSQLNRTVSGDWAEAGTYNGELLVSVVAHN